jgi:tRNA-2-methylthio-N6-dimethylallyladenosine synthase
VRTAIPDAAITTDIIVGFPGETEQDFADTLDIVRRARFAGAFTFQYSIRQGTPAATMDGQVPAEVVAERYGRLAALVEESTLAANQALVGRQVEVLVADGEGRKDGATRRMSGRARDNRLVHFTPSADQVPRPGDVITTVVSRAAPHYLIADGAPIAVRRTSGGDSWQARADGAVLADQGSVGRGSTQAGGTQAGGAGQPVLLGMPALGAPAPGQRS